MSKISIPLTFTQDGAMCWQSPCHRHGASRQKIDGPEALRIGLVHELWPIGDLKKHAIDLAHELANFSATAVREMLGVLVDAENKSLPDLLLAERAAAKACMKSISNAWHAARYWLKTQQC